MQVFASGTDTLNAAGARTLSVELPQPQKGRAVRVSIAANVRDVNRQTSGARTSVIVHPASFYIGAKALGASHQPSFVVTRTVRAPVERVWASLGQAPDLVRRWWGPDGWTCPIARMDVGLGRTSLVAMRVRDGVELYNRWTCTAIEPSKRLEFEVTFARPDGTDPAFHAGPTGGHPGPRPSRRDIYGRGRDDDASRCRVRVSADRCWTCPDWGRNSAWTSSSPRLPKTRSPRLERKQDGWVDVRGVGAPRCTGAVPEPESAA